MEFSPTRAAQCEPSPRSAVWRAAGLPLAADSQHSGSTRTWIRRRRGHMELMWYLRGAIQPVVRMRLVFESSRFLLERASDSTHDVRNI